MSSSSSQRDAAHVLAGDGSFDRLDEQGQAIVGRAWRSRIVALREALNYETEFRAAGESYSEADDQGKVVIHQ